MYYKSILRRVQRGAPLVRQAAWFATKRQQRAAAAAAQKKKNSFSLDKPFVKTDLTDFRDYMATQDVKLDPLHPPPDVAPPSGVVERDLTSEMMDLTDIYDHRLHYSPDFDETYEESTPVVKEMIQLLAVTNRPMTCAQFMQQALTHPDYGYYTAPTSSKQDIDWDDDDWDDGTNDSAHNIIGPKGDFVTAPEISQVFGEMCVVWFMTQWEAMNSSSKHVRLVEVGPGKGTLMADMVRTFLGLPKVAKLISNIDLIEASPAMRREQVNALRQLPGVQWNFENAPDDMNEEGKTDESNHVITVTWHDSFLDMIAQHEKESTENIATFCMCQEFLDALPVHVFEKTTKGWRERLIDVNDDNERNKEQIQVAQEHLSFQPKKKPRLRFVLSPDTTPALRTLLNTMQEDWPVGQIIEVCPQALLLGQDVRDYLARNGGAALFIDYGRDGTGDSLRGFSQHEQVHVLSRPGLVDITADVDFGALRHAINTTQNNSSEYKAFGPIPQGQFLASMGVVERVSQLIEKDETTEKEANELYSALERLCLPEQMGERYKVLAISNGVPAGFKNEDFRENVEVIS